MDFNLATFLIRTLFLVLIHFLALYFLIPYIKKGEDIKGIDYKEEKKYFIDKNN